MGQGHFEFREPMKWVTDATSDDLESTISRRIRLRLISPAHPLPSPASRVRGARLPPSHGFADSPVAHLRQSICFFDCALVTLSFTADSTLDANGIIDPRWNAYSMLILSRSESLNCFIRV